MAEKRSRKDPVTVQGEFFLHRYLWLGADTLAAIETPHGSAFPALASMLLVYFALEAFLNDLGERVAPEVWGQERDFFARGKYRGTLGKLIYLMDQLEVTLNKRARPYSTIVDLTRRRHSLVHPRTERFHKKMPAKRATVIVPDVMGIAPRDFLDKCREDVALMADALQAAGTKLHGSGVVPFDRAFEGSLGYQNTWLPPSERTKQNVAAT